MGAFEAGQKNGCGDFTSWSETNSMLEASRLSAEVRNWDRFID